RLGCLVRGFCRGAVAALYPCSRTAQAEEAVMAVAARPRVQYTDLRGYLDLLYEAGLLRHVSGEVNLSHEVGALCTVGMQRNGPGLVFDNVKGYSGKPLVSNIIYNLDQLAIAFNAEPDPDRLYEIIVDGHRNRIPSVVLQAG